MKHQAAVCLTCLGLLGSVPAMAQVFGAGSGVPSSSQDNQAGVKISSQPAAKQQETAARPVARTSEKATLTSEDVRDLLTPEEAKTMFTGSAKDGSQRGGSGMVMVDEKGNIKKTEKIFMYMRDFNIFRSVGGVTTCDLKLYALSNLDRKIISLDAKLVWPEMTTAVSFSNILPNTPTYFPYTLIGDGCYSLDKMPNIVVNRCRVRGMNSAECASKITWVTAVELK